MSANWASVLVAMIMSLGLFTGFMWRDGRQRGRTDQILRELTRITGDHEDRLRGLEQQGQQGHRARHVR